MFKKPNPSRGPAAEQPTNAPLITTILTTYRRPRLLRRAIGSVLNQTYSHFQLCIYYNASGDETASLVHDISQSDPRVRYFCHSENKGVEFNLKYGVSQVMTPFFSFLPDDDVLLPEFYETAMEGFEKFPDALFSGGICIVMTPLGKVVRASPVSWKKKKGHFSPPEGLFEMLRKTSERHPIITSLVFKKEALEKVGPMDFTEGLPFDLDFILRTAANHSFVMSQKPCSLYILNPLSRYTSKPILLRYFGFKKMIQNFLNNPSIDQVILEAVRPRFADHVKEGVITLALKAFVQRDFASVIELANILKKELRLTQAASLLKNAIASSQNFPERHSKVAKQITAQLLKPIALGALQKKFGHYAEFLW